MARFILSGGIGLAAAVPVMIAPAFAEDTAPGFVPQLNQLAGNLTPRPKCSAANPEFAGSFMAPGQSLTVSEEEEGPHLYQCCIHPWMHAVINVQERGARRP
jgi:hypothetical protein